MSPTIDAVCSPKFKSRLGPLAVLETVSSIKITDSLIAAVRPSLLEHGGTHL